MADLEVGYEIKMKLDFFQEEMERKEREMQMELERKKRELEEQQQRIEVCFPIFIFA